MRINKLYLPIVAITLFIAGCNSTQTDDIGSTNPYPNDVANGEVAASENTYWAKDNLDLQRVGNLLEKADDAEEFEYLLNSDDGINNLDLNGDGYADYISVSEYDDLNDDNQRGFTLFDRFGPNEIQEIASVFLNRDNYNDPGARILLRGNDQIYGDNNYYETNWLDKSLAIASYAFGKRDNTYESPYYYNNYPDYYENYRVVETPVYRQRIQEYYPEPIFIQTNDPTITNIRIRSKYQDKTINNIYARLAKPTREQIDFRKNNPNRPEFVEYKREKIKDIPQKFKEVRERNRNDFEKRGKGKDKDFEVKNKPNKVERETVKSNNFERRNEKPNKAERKMENKVERRMEKVERKMEKQNRKMEKQNKADNPGNGNDKNRGGGKGNGGGNGKGGGKGKH